MSTMTSKSLRFLDYDNDEEARDVDEWLKNERHRSRRDDDDEVQCLSSPINKKAKVMQPDLSNEYICYLDEETKTLEDTHPQTDDGDDFWIRAHNPHRTGSYSKQQSDALEAEFECTKAKYTDDQITMGTCLDLAVRFGVLTGKWIIFWSSNKAGNPAPTWQKIRSAVFDNQLGISAKIQKRAEGNGLFVICIYCRDFRDVQDVHRVRKALDQIIDYKKSLYFKPCALTHMGINANNPYGIRTTLYSCGGEGDCSTLFVNAEKCNNQRDCPRCFPHCRNA